MQTNLYIPKTLTVGFQQRSDTFTGKLAYVIYTDHKGVLRKEKSWESWRDKKIAIQTLNNDPQPGFTLNKGVQRDGHWGSGRSVIRVWDPRDFEFEISIDNLIGILMHADVSKRDITEPCVFAWKGTELILLPTNSAEYQESVSHTEKQERKFSAKDLVIGHTYNVRKDHSKVVYLGRLDRYAVSPVDTDDGYQCKAYQQKPAAKKHVFIDVTSKQVHTKDPSAFLSNVDVEDMNPNFAALLDEYYRSAESQPVAGVTLAHGKHHNYTNLFWCKLSDTEFVELYIKQSYGHERYEPKVTRFARFDLAASSVLLSLTGCERSYYRASLPPISLPGLHDRLPAVQAILADLRTMQDQLVPPGGTHQERYKRTDKFLRAVRGLNTLGRLTFTLANGKQANDHEI